MPVSLALLMAATAALLAISLCAVLWRSRGSKPSSDASAPSAAASMPAGTQTAADVQTIDPAPGASQDGTFLTAQLEVGQTIHVQTRTAKYALTLRSPVLGLFEAVRVGPKRGMVVEERFQMLLNGTFVPNQGLRFGQFVPGGNLCYQKIRDGGVGDLSTSSPILRVLFSIPQRYRQAS